MEATSWRKENPLRAHYCSSTRFSVSTGCSIRRGNLPLQTSFNHTIRKWQTIRKDARKARQSARRAPTQSGCPKSVCRKAPERPFRGASAQSQRSARLRDQAGAAPAYTLSGGVRYESLCPSDAHLVHSTPWNRDNSAQRPENRNGQTVSTASTLYGSRSRWWSSAANGGGK